MKSVVVDTLLPKDTQRRKTVAKFARKVHVLSRSSPDIHYSEWTEKTEPLLWSKPEKLSHNPLISIIVPVFNSPPKYLMPMVYSIINQEFYENWELVLVNASNVPKSIELARNCSRIDTRIKVIDTENKGIAGNTNLGIKESSGEYVGLLDHDDELAPRALYEVARLLQKTHKPQIIYSDEDKLTENGEHRFDVHFKPDWSPQILRQVNYLNHFMVMEKALVDKAGGYRPGFDGAQDYDLFLRLVDERPTIAHIPKVLYHWRAADGSTAQDFSTKKNVLDAGIKALKGHLERNEQEGEPGYLIKQPGFYQISYASKPSTKVAVLLSPTQDIKQYSYLVEAIIKSLAKVSIPTEIFFGETIAKLSSDNQKISLNKIESNGAGDFIKKSLSRTNADTLVVFNAGAIPKSRRWLEELAGILVQVKSVGVVAPILLDYRKDTIVDAGFVKYDNFSVGLFQGLKPKEHTYFGNAVWSRNVDYLSGRIYAARRDIFEKYFSKQAVKLFEPSGFNKLRDDGFEIVVYPQVKMDYHGDLSLRAHSSQLLNPNLSIVRYETGLPKSINLPPGVAE